MPTVDNLTALLNLFLSEPQLGVREMGRRLGIDKSSAQRLASGLARAGFLVKDAESGRYRLGVRFIEFGFVVQARDEVLDVAWPAMQALSRLTGESVHLGVLRDLEMVHIGHIQGRNTSVPEAKVAQRSETYASGLGKAVLAFQDESFVDRVIQGGLRPFTANTITDPTALRRELTLIRRRGYAQNMEELTAGQRSVAAPIRGADGLVFASICISAPCRRMTRIALGRLVEPIQTAATDISQSLGWSEPALSVLSG